MQLLQDRIQLVKLAMISNRIQGWTQEFVLLRAKLKNLCFKVSIKIYK